MSDSDSTLPKPFVFVLMPFDPKYNDIYKFGIKGAADDVAAYAERLDEFSTKLATHTPSTKSSSC